MTDQDYRFRYTVPRKATWSELTAISRLTYGIVLGSAACPLVFFVFQGLTQGEAGWWELAALAGLLLFLFLPYPLWIRRFYFLGIRHDDQIVMRSVSNLIPRAARFELERVRYIRSPDPAASMALVFLDMDRQRLGVFNPNLIPKRKFDQFLKLVREHNPHIKFENW